MRTTILFAIFMIVCSTSVHAYTVADSLRFPLASYSAGGNDFWTYNAIGNSKYHLGEDAEASAGDKVYAIGSGKIMHAQYHSPTYNPDGTIAKKNYGGMYLIEHTLGNGEKVVALYAHMNFASFTKQVGDEVPKGEYLGVIGNSSQNGGFAEHLHFGIRRGAYPENPNAYICGDWIFAGYVACTSVKNDWYDPSEFINAHRAVMATCHGPTTYDANWFYTCDNPATQFRQGQNISFLSRLEQLTKSHTYKVVYKKDGTEIGSHTWYPGYNRLEDGQTWQYSHFWRTLESAEPQCFTQLNQKMLQYNNLIT